MLQVLVWRADCLKQEAPTPRIASLDLVCSPPPQLAEHSVHSLHWVGRCGQGQGSVLQLLTRVRFWTKQEVPWLTTNLLVLSSTPSPPHLSLLVEQLDQELHSVGGGREGQLQASKLQVRHSVKVSRLHEDPQPLATSLLRTDLPPPQGSEQLLQRVHSVVASRSQPEIFSENKNQNDFTSQSTSGMVKWCFDEYKSKLSSTWTMCRPS